jgi:hypothetical protein
MGVSLLALIDRRMSVFAFHAFFKLFFLPNIVVLHKLPIEKIGVRIVLFLDFPIIKVSWERCSLQLKISFVHPRTASLKIKQDLDGDVKLGLCKSSCTEVYAFWGVVKYFNEPILSYELLTYFMWAGSLSTFALNTMYGKILSMSSVHAGLIPSSVEKYENVLSNSLRQLEMQACLDEGVKHLSLP